MAKKHIHCALLVISTFLVCTLLGCEPVPGGHARTSTGQDLGKREWQVITDQDSVMYIRNAPDVRRIEAQNTLYDRRYQEKISLSSGFISYEKVYGGGFDTRIGLKEALYHSVNDNKNLKERYNLNIDRDDVKRTIINGVEYAYVAKQGGLGVCFIFKAFFGNAYGLSLGDQHVHGGACYPIGRVSVTGLQSEWLGLLGRIGFDGPRPGWASTVTKTEQGHATDRRPIAIKWEGMDELIAGTISLRRGERAGQMSLTLPNDEGTCRGTYQITPDRSGMWAVACTNNLAASGTFTASSSSKASSGDGTDSRGRRVHFTLSGSRNQFTTTVENDRMVLKQGNSAVQFKEKKIARSNAQEFLDEVEGQRLKISKYLRRGQNQRFTWTIGSDREITSWDCGDPVLVYVQPSRVIDNIVPIEQPIAECIMGRSSNLLWKIGFRTFLQEMFGRSDGFPFYGADSHLTSWQIIKFKSTDFGDNPIMSLYNNPNVMVWKRKHDNRDFYRRTSGIILSTSFCRFIIEQIFGGDINKFIKFIETIMLKRRISVWHS